MPAKMEIKQGFWLMIGILLALFVVGVVLKFAGGGMLSNAA